MQRGTGLWNGEPGIGIKTYDENTRRILKGERAHGEMLSIAVAGEGQQQDAGAKTIHLVLLVRSRAIYQSIRWRSSYRGRVMIGPKAKVQGPKWCVTHS